MKMIFNVLKTKLFICLLLMANLGIGQINPGEGCTQDCNPVPVLNIGTGIDANGAQLPCAVGTVDPFWRLINNPPIQPCTNPLINTINGNAFVMNHDNITGSTVWANQPGVRTIAPVDGSCDTNFGCNNLQNSAGQFLPYIFERTFCMCFPDDIIIDVGVKGDDQVILELWDITNSTLMATSPTFNFANGPAATWNHSDFLPVGTYAIRANLANISSTVLGFSVAGTITAGSGQPAIVDNTQCCENNTINVRKVLDLDCDGAIGANDQIGAGWFFELYDQAGNLVQSGTTNINGELFFNGVLTGNYTIREVPQLGWNFGTPANGQINITVSPGSFNVVTFFNCPDIQSPCDDLDIIMTPATNDGCCYVVDVGNNYSTNPIVGLEANILTPDWIFNTASISTASGWTWSGIPSATQISMAHNSGSFPSGNISNLLRFCLANTDPAATNPQQIEFTWYELMGNDTVAICDTIMLADCIPGDPVLCTEIINANIECDSLDNVYKLTFQVQNNTSSTATNVMLYGNAGYSFRLTPGGPDLSSIILPVSIPPNGTSAPLCVYIYSPVPVTAPTNIYFNYSIWGSDFCCHSPVPYCTQLIPCDCLETSNFSIVCDSNKYVLTFDVTNKSTISPAATALVVTVKNPTTSGITLPPTGGFFNWSSNPLPYNATRTVTTCVDPFPISDPNLILGYALHHGAFPFPQDSCCIASLCDTIPIPICDTCCDDYDEFCDQVDAGYTYTLNPTDCEIRVLPNALDSCQYVTWDWGDGTTTGPLSAISGPFTHVYSGSGGYAVCMTVYEQDADGDICWEKQFCDQFSITCDGCCSDYQAFCDRVDAGFAIAFNDPTSCTIGVSPLALNECDRVIWSWGDGTTSTGTWNTSNTHTYAVGGTYTICIIVREIGPDGTVCWEKVHYIDVVVECPPPPCCTDYQAFCDRVDDGFVIAFNDPTTCTIGVSPNGLSECDQIVWNWGDGTTSTGTWNTSNTHTYTASGVYTVCMIVQEIGPDGLCWEKEYCLEVEVQCGGCCSDYQAFCDRVDSGFIIAFNDPATCTIGVSPNGLSECDQIVWNWGDGTTSTGTWNTSNTHTYTASGVYTVCMIVQEVGPNGVCWEKEYCLEVEVECGGCCSDYQAFCDRVDAGINIGFNNPTDCSIGVSPIGLSDCDQVTWSWGDGTSSPGSWNTGVPHTYPGPGVYTVCMIVQEVGADGTVCWEKEHCIEVEVQCDDCCTDQQAFDNRVNAFLFSIPGPNNNCTMTVGVNLTECDQVTWIWGDGTTTGPLPGTSATTTHVYTSGSYTVCMLVEEVDASGNVCWSKEVCYNVIADCPPIECCPDYETFCDQVDAGFSITTSNTTVTATPTNPFPECYQVTWIWGDNTFDDGATHTYDNPGIYNACMIVTANDPTTGVVCHTKEYCRKVVILTNPCPPIIDIEAVGTPNGLYQAAEVLNYTGTIPAEGNVGVSAGEIILLDSGFRTGEGAEFSAIIEDCDENIPCWDINRNGSCDLQEDTNGDGTCDTADCAIFGDGN